MIKRRLGHYDLVSITYSNFILERVPKSKPDVDFMNNAQWSVTILRFFMK